MYKNNEKHSDFKALIFKYFFFLYILYQVSKFKVDLVVNFVDHPVPASWSFWIFVSFKSIFGFNRFPLFIFRACHFLHDVFGEGFNCFGEWCLIVMLNLYSENVFIEERKNSVFWMKAAGVNVYISYFPLKYQ